MKNYANKGRKQGENLPAQIAFVFATQEKE